MGDHRRFHIFAEFIHYSFPDASTVADVGGGRGILSFLLNEFVKHSTIIDPRPATFPRWIHRRLRKKARRTGTVSIIERVHQNVESVDLSRFDLTVALHPDEATEPTLRYAIKHNINLAIVPCCVFPLDGYKRSVPEWMNYLLSIAPDVKKHQLPFSGANTVLWRTSNR